MTAEPASKVARRQIAVDFKDRKVPRGIYVIRCLGSGEAWVGSSTNLNAAQNSQWFQLRAGLHRIATLQEAWMHHTEQAFQFEVLEQLDEDVSPLLMNDLLKTKKKEWTATLQAKVL